MTPALSRMTHSLILVGVEGSYHTLERSTVSDDFHACPFQRKFRFPLDLYPEKCTRKGFLWTSWSLNGRSVPCGAACARTRVGQGSARVSVSWWASARHVCQCLGGRVCVFKSESGRLRTNPCFSSVHHHICVRHCE